jgi:hypothetical protein
MITLVEFENFTRFAAKNLSLDEIDALKEFLAMAPEEGAVIQGTGGLRKLRWATQGRGKSGGVRVIYYYHNQGMPLLLLDGFAKNEMENISQAARNAYKKLMPLLVEHYLSRNKKCPRSVLTKLRLVSSKA